MRLRVILQPRYSNGDINALLALFAELGVPVIPLQVLTEAPPPDLLGADGCSFEVLSSGYGGMVSSEVATPQYESGQRVLPLHESTVLPDEEQADSPMEGGLETLEVQTPIQSVEQTKRVVQSRGTIEDILLDNIEKREDFDIKDGMPYNHYAVKPETREQFLTAELKRELQCTRQWYVGHFDFEEGVTDTYLPRLAMQNARDSKSKQTIALSLLKRDGSAASKSPALQFTGDDVHLPEAVCKNMGTYLAVYNRGKTKSRRICSSAGQFTLGPDEGVVLIVQRNPQNDQPEWLKVAGYAFSESEIHTNPLMVDEEPTLVGLQSSQHNGEFFLTQPILKSLSEYYGVDVYCSSPEEVETTARDFLLSEQQARSLIYTDTISNHTVLVRLLKDRGRIIAYLHETLGPEAGISRKIRVEIKEQVESVITDFRRSMKLHLCYPACIMQKDMSSCGVFALKAGRAFLKRSELDTWLKTEAVDKAGNSSVKEQKIATAKIPAVLLKNCQNSRLQLSPEQLDTVVSGYGKPGKGLTLRKYLAKYRKTREAVGSLKAVPSTNFSALCKRYKLLMKYDGLASSGVWPHQASMEVDRSE